MKKGRIHIGLSGYSYTQWKGIFYPEGFPTADYLSYYAQFFNVVELNSTFYSLPRASTVENWIAKVPDDFIFCPKTSKYLTHIKRLKEPEEPLERFFNAIAPMAKRTGPVLIQLPPSLKFDYDSADFFFSLLRQKYKQYEYVLEGRHATWFEEDALNLLAKHEVALVISESGDRFPYSEMVTAKNIYVRFHGAEELFISSYSDEVLEAYAKKFLGWKKEGHHLWIFFNNTMYESGLSNAIALKAMMNED